jgi:hypothetical protein
MIFPGMDPYLEDPQIWPGVHSALVVYLRDHLQPQLRPRYIAAIEERVFVEGPRRDIFPDVWLRRGRPEPRGPGAAVLDREDDTFVEVQVPAAEIHEPYVALLDRQSGQSVVTVIEVVSPTNKYAGPGRESYLAKQAEVRSSPTHLIEIDLLRTGPHVLAVPEWVARGQGLYNSLACVNRARGLRDRFQLYPRGLRQRLPRVRVPLAGDDPDALLDVQAVLAQTYEAGCYRDRLRYDASCVPPLASDDQAWADGLVRQAMQAGA